ncbi:Gfo/Idh/MocA family protein [Fictibacillus phosphorivorans]|uniref:Gfo/Idh/MocA family protein n=1 Tax=Fictibacillus phosphorivorans TaxID=1221500 RepID=UPI00203B91ED|nr:Gfo/Idh/MocA family oxidoreductase [Fictibacillus phosphorivorans]MCM3718138.1 Gfo/Idh/MocA family oxidoreductase [Fictibacillus phosphorivorans]MCM3775765.1 Gfo/Idh/MocA family oxidoreductase [Fictibacillus phosphorivorans]
MKKVRIGIIGVGIIGKNHLDEYAKLDGAEVVAACDLNETELKTVAENYKIPDTYTDFREMLKRDDIDAVDVCLHNNLHAPVTIAALKAGKHVYCEKPIAGSYVDGKRMIDAAKEYGKMLHVQLSFLYGLETKAAKVLIDEGKLGKLYHARSTGFRRRGRPYVDGYGTKEFNQKEIAAGGALFDMGVYRISQLLYLMNLPKVKTITGKTYQEMEMDEKRREISGFNVEELGLGFVRFEGGLTLDIIESWAIHQNGLGGSSIVGNKGGITFNGKVNGANAPLSYHTIVGDMDMDATFDLGGADYRWHQLRENTGAYDSSQSHWVAALQGRVPLLPTAEIALQTMLISEGIYLSDRLEREVTAEEVIEHSKSQVVLPKSKSTEKEIVNDYNVEREGLAN